jgi:hydrogenase/urease accessory protein HupE
MNALRLALVGCAMLFFASVQAHTKSTGLATVDARSAVIAFRLSITPSELGDAAAEVPRAAAGDTASATRVAAWLNALVQLAVDDKPCKVQRTRLQSSQLGDERVVLMLDFNCSTAPGRLRLTDRLSTQFGEHYRTIASFTRTDGVREERVLDHEHTEAVIDMGRAAPSSLFAFLTLGIEHMLSGLDHLLFLAALLVASRGIKSLLLTVTAFTLAHSLSLAISVLGFASVTPTLVEPLIAASILWIAIENIWFKPSSLRRYALAFVFGLVHGLAFAEGLRALKLVGWPLARALFGFNLGVELAQALVVVLLAPVIAWLARRPGAQNWIRASSVLIGAAGLFWLVERTLLV